MLRPRSWPVRWRLALVSSALTLAILLLFGGLIGKIATDRIRDDFNGEVTSATKILAGQFQVVYSPFGGKAEARAGPQLDAFVLPDDATARILDTEQNLLSFAGTAPLGPPRPGLTDYNGMRVATEPILDESRAVTGYVQYGRSLDHVEATIDRVWLLILAGILVGTLLAVVAGVAIARRAMRPIASLTTTAREIATTRDPSQQMPKPKADDEVGELARTLEEMLRALDAARAEREGVMQKQREFVADASHELRTPLTSVLANLELLQASLGGSDQAEDREIVDSALRSSKRMGRLVSDLLLLARADAGRLDRRQRMNLADIAGDAAVEVAPLMGDRRLAVDNERPLW
ncbi:MAG TPA: histidine kinase dimerization/phospho-acceptor domain-containing protein, partial [Solirubrobacterales bacterium]